MSRVKPVAIYTALIASALALYGVTKASATVPECQAQVLATVTDDLGNTWKAGQIVPATIERDDSHGGALCASGGSCIPRSVNGEPALRLLNCTVGPSISNTDHRLVPSAALAGRKTADAMIARNDAEQKLSALGFSNASAGTLAEEFVDHPHSQNARLVGRALAGSAAATALLKRTYP